MNRSRRIAVAASVLAALSTGCSGESNQLATIAGCGDLHFPSGATVAWFDEEGGFGDTVTDAVVDIPREAEQEFLQQSRLPELTPGRPKYWSDFWTQTGMGSVLASDDRNRHTATDTHEPQRYVIIHDLDTDSERLFIRAFC